MIRVDGVVKTPEYQVTCMPFKYGIFGCLFVWAEQYRLRGRTGQESNGRKTNWACVNGALLPKTEREVESLVSLPQPSASVKIIT
jgi:hypothetical protein